MNWIDIQFTLDTGARISAVPQNMLLRHSTVVVDANSGNNLRKNAKVVLELAGRKFHGEVALAQKRLVQKFICR